MADPLYPVETIKYKTYIKSTLGKALRNIFSNHPDAILSKTKATIEFPMTEAEYPSVVIRFYEREIKSAGVSHEEYLQIANRFADQETWFDNFEGFRTAADYKIKAGTYAATGILSATPNEMMPWKPTQEFGASNVGHGSHVKVSRASGEVITVRTGLTAALDTSIGFIAEAGVSGNTLTLKIIYRDVNSVETVLQTATVGSFTAATFWIDFSISYDGSLSLKTYDGDPLSSSSVVFVGGEIAATATSPQMATISPNNNRYWVGGSGAGTLSSIDLFRTFKTNVADYRFHRFKHYLYNGDIEFAVYALSSYDRDLIADTVVQILAMGDLTSWTGDLSNAIYEADILVDPESVNHMINLNTDSIQGFGETQQIAPWMPEDVMVYQTSYRVGIFGEFYSKTPTTGDIGLVERVETYPYMGESGDPVPEPANSGPDHVQGTADDIPDSTPWQG